MKMYPMQQKIFAEFLYCITCGRMVRVVHDEFHFAHAYNLGSVVCHGPFTSCPPPEEGGFLLASDADLEQEEPEPTYEDVHIMQTVDELLTHIVNN